DVELPIVKKTDAAPAGFDRGFENVPRILNPVHVADFVAIERRDRQFCDAQFPEHKLDDDLSVEMELVRIFLERNLPQSSGRIKPVTGVKLREVRSQHPVLERSQ